MRRYAVLLSTVLALWLAGCSGGGSDSSSSSGSTTGSTSGTNAVTTREATAPPSPAATPRPCTSTPDIRATPLPQGIEIRGPEEFKLWTQRALDLLKTKAPENYADVLLSVSVIESVESGSGMVVLEKRFKVGAQTAYAPGFSQEQQLIWYAGTIVHDAHHSLLCGQAQTYSGKEAEIACLKEQKEALLKIETGSYFSNYVQGLIDGADDPANQYWTQANRHW